MEHRLGQSHIQADVQKERKKKKTNEDNQNFQAWDAIKEPNLVSMAWLKES